uniref:PSP1 C-terminal domain-containing protein n=1 Tax=Mycena chlorophos TaxID=658473 RepID=A0ABQ0LNG7_MYCCL|nr:predicted protein [Mycena chlorophos]
MADDNASSTNNGNGNGSTTTAQAPSQSPGPGEQQRRHRFLPPTSPVEPVPARPPSHSPLSHGHRAASQPPHPASGFASPPLVPASLSGDGGSASTRSPSAWSHGQQQMLSSVRSASFSSSGGGGGGRGTFGSTFEDDELVDPDDELYDARYGSPYGRGRNPASHAPIDLSRSRSHSLATTGAIVGAGRFDSLSSSASSGVGIGIGGNAVGVGGGGVAGGGGGYNPNANFGRGIGSAANSFVTSNLYGNNAYAGHNNLYPGSRWGNANRRRDDHGRDRENTSPFMRDVGSLVLDDGPGSSFRELWERERAGSSSSGLGLGLGGGGSSYGSSSGGRYAHQYGEYEDDYGIGDDGEEDEYDYGPGGWESGATSRRHSVSGAVSVPPHPHPMQYQQQHQPVQQLQPRARVSGFNAPEQPGTGPTDSPGAGYGRRGGGGLLLSDDDLEGALGHLSLNTNTAHSHSHSQYPAAGAGPLSPLSPTNAGRGRYLDQQQAEHEQGLPRSLSQQRSSTGLAQGQGQGHGVGKDWADAYFSPQAGGGPPSPVLGRGGAPTRASYAAHPHAHQPHPTHLPHQQQHLPPHAHPAQHQHQHAPPQQQQQQQSHQPQLQGKGIPLHAVPPDWPLYIVEFKAGRTDLFYLPPDSKSGAEPASIRVGDLVIVEADRGKDLGKVINDSITIGEVEAYWAQGRGGPQPSSSPPTSPTDPSSSSSSSKKEISPKMIYGKAGAGDAQLLVAKMQDELKALALCQTKVRAKKLPMEVVDAEYQWDRRKLTFYFVAEKRIDFRELVRELFRLYKTRIWMAALSGSVGGGGGFEA